MKKTVTFILPKDSTRKYKICVRDERLDVNMVMELGHTRDYQEMKRLFGYNTLYLLKATEHYMKEHEDCTQYVYIWEE